MAENIIKSKRRVQKHGEVFTPRSIVEMMLNTPEIKTACENLTTTFLEPAAGEGAFLVAILERKLNMVKKEYNQDLRQFENFSLLALTTLYGIELLEDNTQTCVMNMFEKYYDFYKEVAFYYGEKEKKNVLDSAKEIISSNIEQGDFLTRKDSKGNPLIFSEWKPIHLRKNSRNIKVQRTEYTLDEIYQNVQKEAGLSINGDGQKYQQMNIFDILEINDPIVEPYKMKYTVVPITEVYKVEMEEI